MVDNVGLRYANPTYAISFCLLFFSYLIFLSIVGWVKRSQPNFVVDNVGLRDSNPTYAISV
ncbi:MAG: hypothetical protein AAF208_04860 [Cyanobacteria bacterium P01_A01_bin.45]